MKTFTQIACMLVATLFSVVATSSDALAGVKVSKKTKYYSITGTNARDFALSMSRKGPYSYQHRKRAWATAARDMSYQLTHRRSGKRCRVSDAKVVMKITYTMPKLRTRGVSGRERKKWRKMFSLLNKHERRHGTYYTQLAHRTYKALRKMRPATSCNALERNAMKIVKKLSDDDLKRNDRFDRRDSGNYRRMARIYRR